MSGMQIFCDPAFAVPPASAASSFTTPARLSSGLTAATTTPLRTASARRSASAAPASRRVTMIQNPFRNKKANQPESDGETAFMAPQAGDPGYKPPPPVEKGFGMTKSEPRLTAQAKKEKEEKEAAEAAAKVEAEAKISEPGGNTSLKSVTPKTTAAAGSVAAKPGLGGVKLPVSGGDVKRGLDLLKEDLLKNAPQRAGVGRQDVGAVMKPLPGEPGYKPAAYETVKVSELGISPFPDDANAVGKVGGVEAVKKAAVDVKVGKKTASEIKKQVLKIETKAEEEKVFDIPDYLKPLPEDTPRKGLTWKNYVGR